MGEYPASIAALDDQGDLEFVAERIYGGGEQALAKVRHGNAVMLTCRPFGVGGGQVRDGRQHGLGVRPRTRRRCATRHEQRRYPVVRYDETAQVTVSGTSLLFCIRYKHVDSCQKNVK